LTDYFHGRPSRHEGGAFWRLAVLILSRYDSHKNESKSKVNIYHDGQLIGTVTVKAASHGLARLGFEFAGDYRILREECDLCEGKECSA
jgi:hypothetical protein